ncbi:MAG: hypothetical protein AAGD11_01940 [Planctomycetota bacterium]
MAAAQGRAANLQACWEWIFIRPKLGGFVMPRSPKPWYWKQRKAFYVTIDGKRHCLGKDKDAAFVRFHQLMAEPQQQVIHSGSLIDLFERFLDWTEKHRAPDTYEWYRFRLERFLQKNPDLQVHQLKPYHVQEWIDEMDGLASGSRKNYCRAIKRCLRWCKQQGYIGENPISEMALPRGGKRNLVVSHVNGSRKVQRLAG